MKTVAANNFKKDKLYPAVARCVAETVYRKWGRGGERVVLRFSKFEDPNLEAAYSRCYLATSPPRREIQVSKPNHWP
jgi:hypothetical protein